MCVENEFVYFLTHHSMHMCNSRHLSDEGPLRPQCFGQWRSDRCPIEQRHPQCPSTGMLSNKVPQTGKWHSTYNITSIGTISQILIVILYLGHA